jgi:hypothetical protein
MRVAWTIAVTLLAITFLRAVDSPVSVLGSPAVSLVSTKANRLPGLGHDNQPPLTLVRVVWDVPPIVHAPFLLFDFKQNLRRWPVLAGDISRSPPSLLAL